ncbi:hypothetical protein [Mastigocladopsis repens]|uniref:hypothetical protein n=1 Tax=Mastigocladopsis repens TaxID=221287 RepID=UPI0012E9E3DE|nr:hypothetical protein [Mastigocladopsis repens]
MTNNNFCQLRIAISHSKGIHKLFATAMLVFAIVYPSSFAQAGQLNDNYFNNAFGQQSSKPEVNPVDNETQPLVLARRYHRRYRVRPVHRPMRRYRVRPVYRPMRRYRVRPVYRPMRRYRVRPVYRPIRRYNRYKVQRVYVR